MSWSPLKYLLVAWFATAVVRVILGSNTSLIGYFFFGLICLLSAVLLIMAIRLLVIAESKEQRVEAISVGLVMAAVLGQGLFGSRDTIRIATVVFFVSLIVLAYIYCRRLRRRHQSHHLSQ